MTEQAVLFGPRQTLVGVVTWPAAPDHPLACPAPLAAQNLTAESGHPVGTGAPAVILLNAGILHHVGPNRAFVRIARRLAALGLVVLRFDFSGIGDSLPREDNLPFERASLQEVQHAMATLHDLAGSTQFVLMGLCSGANVSFRAAQSDPRVVGAVLINPNGHLHDNHDEALGNYLHNRALLDHYRRMLLASSFGAKNWLKILAGNWNLPLLLQAVRGFRPRNPFAHRQTGPGAREQALTRLRGISARGVRLLHVYSEGDEGLDYFRLVLGKEADALDVMLIRGANHTFTPLWSQEELVEVIGKWVREFAV